MICRLLCAAGVYVGQHHLIALFEQCGGDNLSQTSGSASCYDHNLESQSVAVYFQFNK